MKSWSDIEHARQLELAKWKVRSDAAKRAADTKRLKYKKWPTRKNDHK